MQHYLVGGAVRDKLLGRKVSDKDWVVVGETQESMLNRGFAQVGADFPVFLHPQTKQEYALARTERKQGKGYKGFSISSDASVTLEQDLIRRDLTINAMAMDEKGELIDPFNGKADLDARCLRHVSPAFAEDPLRVLRVARFAARFKEDGFSVADETMTLMKFMVNAGELDHLTPERVWKETSRALMEQHPQVYFEVLKEVGALAVWFPELDRLWGIPNPPKWHPEVDTGIHTMMVLQQAVNLTDKLPVRYAALVHDLGKGLTDPQQWPSHRGHETLGLEPIEQLSERLKVPNDCKELGLMVSKYHTHVHRAFELKPATLLKVFDGCDAWRKPQRFQDMLLTCKADARGRTGFERIDYPQADYMYAAFLSANEVSVQPIIEKGFKGKAIREQLDHERRRCIKLVATKWSADQEAE